MTEGFSTAQRPVTDVSGSLELVVSFEPRRDRRSTTASGHRPSWSWGPPASLIREGDGRGTDLTRTLTLDPRVGEGVLHIAARAASCDLEGGEGAACRMHQQDWGVPIRVTSTGDAHLVLPLGGSA